MIKGHVTVCKVYKDGTKEVVLDRANMITAGLGSSFLDIQQEAGSASAVDYAPAYFQLGTGVPTFHAIETSSFIYRHYLRWCLVERTSILLILFRDRLLSILWILLKRK